MRARVSVHGADLVLEVLALSPGIRPVSCRAHGSLLYLAAGLLILASRLGTAGFLYSLIITILNLKTPALEFF